MDQFFTQGQTVVAQPPPPATYDSNPIELGISSDINPNEFDMMQPNASGFSYDPNVNFKSNEVDNEFNDFEEDQVTRKIRQEQEKVQNMLKQKSQKEYEDKRQRREEGRRQLEEFMNRKQEEKRQRAAENVKRQEEIKQEREKLNVQAGWKKVISTISLKQGERKGAKDINRMREVIIHKREDQS